MGFMDELKKLTRPYSEEDEDDFDEYEEEEEAPAPAPAPAPTPRARNSFSAAENRSAEAVFGDPHKKRYKERRPE